MNAEIQMRDAARADLAAAVEAHLAAGGTIHRLSHCERAPTRCISYNNRVDRKSAGRREYLELDRLTPGRTRLNRWSSWRVTSGPLGS